jgi:hypothetical protein
MVLGGGVWKDVAFTVVFANYQQVIAAAVNLFLLLIIVYGVYKRLRYFRIVDVPASLRLHRWRSDRLLLVFGALTTIV